MKVMTYALAVLCCGCAYHNPTVPTPLPLPVVAIPLPPPPVVQPPPPKPVESLNVTLLWSNLGAGDVQFGVSLPGNIGATVAWNFDDGTTATGPSPKHRYSNGTWHPKVVVTAPDGRTASDTTVIIVDIIELSKPPPKPLPTPDPDPSLSAFLSCTSSSMTISCNVGAVDERGVAISSNGFDKLRWDFGDGTVLDGTLPTVQHAYGQSGTFFVRVSASVGNRKGSAVAVVKVE